MSWKINFSSAVSHPHDCLFHVRIFSFYTQPSPGKKLKFKVFAVQDATPITFNGCRLQHNARKRYRRHSFDNAKLVRYLKHFVPKNKY